jgi:hypothetical protein
MSTKQLEIASVVCGLVGTFLLTIQPLVGVENAVRWLLSGRERLFWLQQYLTPKKELILGPYPDHQDLKKEETGTAFNLVPYEFMTSIVIFASLFLYFIQRNFGYIVEGLTRNIEHGIWGYLLYPFSIPPFWLGPELLQGLVLVVGLIYGFALGLILFHLVFWTALLGAATVVVLLVRLVFFTVPAKLLGWLINTNQERKLSWLGLLVAILGSILHILAL